jgi:hypothetical protein
MADWTMAMVLKTSTIGFARPVMFSAPTSLQISARCGQSLRDLADTSVVVQKVALPIDVSPNNTSVYQTSRSSAWSASAS